MFSTVPPVPKTWRMESPERGEGGSGKVTPTSLAGGGTGVGSGDEWRGYTSSGSTLMAMSGGVAWMTGRGAAAEAGDSLEAFLEISDMRGVLMG